ncbi:2-phosphoglycerate kinase, partial [Bienertia sinuspersici]
KLLLYTDAEGNHSLVSGLIQDVDIWNNNGVIFVVPDGEIYINKILSRITKAWRQSQEEHYNAMPCGTSRDNWIKLVKHWFSGKGQYMLEYGKEARASQCHIHIYGGKSYANIRSDY